MTAPTSTGCAGSSTPATSATRESSGTRLPRRTRSSCRVQQQKKEGRDITAEVLALLRQGLGASTDPARLDLNIQGRDNLAARLLAADPDHVAGKPGTNPADYYARVAEEIVGQRSRLGIFRSPADVDGVANVSTAIKDWVKANTTTGPFVLLSAENVGPAGGRGPAQDGPLGDRDAR